MNKSLLALFGLAFNPFGPEVPTEALRLTPELESFFWKIQQTLLREGGFALIVGESGSGKSVALRLLAHQLARESELVVGAISRPQANVADFYRELGEVFGVPLRPHNRWGGSKALRERWTTHIETTLMRPVLLLDEAQESSTAVLNELRFLGSTRFDSRQILTVVLAGDTRLVEKFRQDDLLPLGSRIRTRLALQAASTEELRSTLKHLIAAAGNSALMTPELIATLSEHALGNYRVLMTLCGELLSAAARKELPRLDEKLYLELFSVPKAASSPAAARTRR
jgi:type II secretory pathway predicted ATPase ExeA